MFDSTSLCPSDSAKTDDLLALLRYLLRTTTIFLEAIQNRVEQIVAKRTLETKREYELSQNFAPVICF